MAEAKKEILLVGFGAVGVIYAYIFHKSGQARVTAVARGNYEILKDGGIHIKSAKYGSIPSWKPDRLFKSLEEALDRPYDYVVVATKSLPELNPTSVLLWPLVQPSYPFPQPVFVLLQNGLSVEQDLYDSLVKLERGKPKIITCAVYITTNLIGDGTFVEHGDFARVLMGLYRASLQDQKTINVLETFANIIHDGGGVAEIVPDIQLAKFTKNIWNVAFSTTTSLTRQPVAKFFETPGVSAVMAPLVKELILENIAVGRALGYDETLLPISLVDTLLGATKKMLVSHKASMLVDVETGRPMELEVILGEVVRAARRLGVNVPRLETLYGLLVVVQSQIVTSMMA